MWWCRRYRAWGLDAAVGSAAGLVAHGWAERSGNLAPELLETLAIALVTWAEGFRGRSRGESAVRAQATAQIALAWAGAGDAVHALSWLSRRPDLEACGCAEHGRLHARGDEGCAARRCPEAEGYWSLALEELVTAAALARAVPRPSAVALGACPAPDAAALDAAVAIVLDEAADAWRAAGHVEAWIDREELGAYLRAGLFVAGDAKPILVFGASLRAPSAYALAPAARCQRDGCGDDADEHDVADAGLGRGRCGAPGCGCTGFVGGAGPGRDEPLPVTLREGAGGDEGDAPAAAGRSEGGAA